MKMSKFLTVFILNLSFMAGYAKVYKQELFYFVYGYQAVGEPSGFHVFLPNIALESPMMITMEINSEVNRSELLIFYNTMNRSIVTNLTIIEIQPLRTENRRICHQTAKLQSVKVILQGLDEDFVFLTCAIDSAKKFEVGYYNIFLTGNFMAKFDAKKFNKPINFLVNGSRINECYCRNNQAEEKISAISNDSILGRFLTALFIVTIIILCMLLFNINLRE
jgi:hypothetical protein